MAEEKIKLCLIVCVCVWSLVQSEEHIINQHTCEVIGVELKCGYKGEGVYSVDRLLSTITSIRFEFFGSGRVQIGELVPDLRMVVIERSGVEVREMCGSIHVGQGVKVQVMGKLCEIDQSPRTTSVTSADTPLTEVNTLALTVGVSVEVVRKQEKYEGEKKNNNHVYKIVMIVLAACLCVVMVYIVCKIVKKKCWKKKRDRLSSIEDIIEFEAFKNK